MAFVHLIWALLIEISFLSSHLFHNHVKSKFEEGSKVIKLPNLIWRQFTAQIQV